MIELYGEDDDVEDLEMVEYIQDCAENYFQSLCSEDSAINQGRMEGFCQALKILIPGSPIQSSIDDFVTNVIESPSSIISNSIM